MEIVKAAIKRKFARKVQPFNELTISARSIYSAKSIVKYSFIVQKSITYLDLSLCEFSKSKRKYKKHKLTNFAIIPLIVKNTILTEEACKKRLAPNRKILYNFHLDVSKELEISLRNPRRPKIRHFFSERIFLNMLEVTYNIHDICLNRIITEVFEESSHKVKLIQSVAKMVMCVKFISQNECIRSKGLAYLCFQCTDSNIIKDFLIAMGFDGDYFFNLSLHIFERVLYHAHRTGYNLWALPPYQDPIHSSIRYCMFAKTESLFQYRSAPRFCEVAYNSMRVGRSLGVPEIVLHIPVHNRLMTRERHFLILEIIFSYAKEYSRGLRALQMLWRSIPYPYISLAELSSVLARVPDKKHIELLSDFMKQITGEDVPKYCLPRTLKHYCRTTIRSILCRNNEPLATVIGKLKMPRVLESFLRLEI